MGRKRQIELAHLRAEWQRAKRGRHNATCELPLADSALIAAALAETKLVAAQLGMVDNTLASFLASPNKSREYGTVLLALLAIGATSKSVDNLFSDPNIGGDFRSLLEEVEDHYVVKVPTASKTLGKILGVETNNRWRSIVQSAQARLDAADKKKKEQLNVRDAISTLPERILSLGMLTEFRPGVLVAASDVERAINETFTGHGTSGKVGMPHIRIALDELEREGHVDKVSKNFRINILDVEEWGSVIEHRKLNELRAVDSIAKNRDDCRAVLNDLEEWRTHMVEAASANGRYSPIDFFESDIGFHSVLAASTPIDRALQRALLPYIRRVGHYLWELRDTLLDDHLKITTAVRELHKNFGSPNHKVFVEKVKTDLRDHLQHALEMFEAMRKPPEPSSIVDLKASDFVLKFGGGTSAS